MSDTRSEPTRQAATPHRRNSRLLTAASGKFGILLLALVALMAATPLIISGPVWNTLLSLFTGAVMVASLYAARPGERAVVIGLILALIDFAIGRCAVTFTDLWWLVALQITLWLGTLVYVIATLLEKIFDSEIVTLETLQASLCVYLLLGVMGGFGFALVDLILPGSFQPAHGPAVDWKKDDSRATEFMRLFVLSYATLSGASFAEIAPATGFASNASSLLAMSGQIYLAVVIARLVGLHASSPPAREPPCTDNGACPPTATVAECIGVTDERDRTARSETDANGPKADAVL